MKLLAFIFEQPSYDFIDRVRAVCSETVERSCDFTVNAILRSLACVHSKTGLALAVQQSDQKWYKSFR